MTWLRLTWSSLLKLHVPWTISTMLAAEHLRSALRGSTTESRTDESVHNYKQMRQSRTKQPRALAIRAILKCNKQNKETWGPLKNSSDLQTIQMTNVNLTYRYGSWTSSYAHLITDINIHVIALTFTIFRFNNSFTSLLICEAVSSASFFLLCLTQSPASEATLLFWSDLGLDLCFQRLTNNMCASSSTSTCCVLSVLVNV